MAADGDRFSFEVTADGRSAATPKDRQFVNSLARGFEILRAFAPNDTLLGNQEIAERTGLPKPTVSRLTYTLTRLGYLTYLDRLAKYQLGTSVLALGYAALASMGIRQIAKPHMQALADFAGASIGLGSRAQPDAGARTASSHLRTGDDDALDPFPQREQALRQLLVVAPHWRAGIQQPLRPSVSCGPEVQISPPPR